MQISSLEVRRATADDAGRIDALYGQLVGDIARCVLPERIQELSENPKAALLVSEVNGLVCGTALVLLCDDVMFRRQPFAVVENVVVDVTARNQGVGARLLRAVEAYCALNDCSKIMFLSSIGRSDAHRFLKEVALTRPPKKVLSNIATHLLDSSEGRSRPKADARLLLGGELQNMSAVKKQNFRSIARLSLALIFPAVLLVTGECAPIEVRESRKLDAFLTSSQGEPPAKIAQKLALRGYACTAAPEVSSGKKAMLQCSNQRDNLWPPYSCVFRVDLEAEPIVGSSGTSPVVSHACAGL